MEQTFTNSIATPTSAVFDYAISVIMGTKVRQLSGQKMNEALDALDRGNISQAVDGLKKAIQIDPTYFRPWLNLGLAEKRLGHWRQSYSCFCGAWSKIDSSVSSEIYASILWNIAITGTIIEEWRRVRWAWSFFGHDIDIDVNEPPSLPMGFAWVVRSPSLPVLGERLDPVRMRLMHDEKENTILRKRVTIVHDGERVGTKAYDGEELPIFPFLAISNS